MGMSAEDLERRSRELYEESIDAIDMRTRSRLTQARHAALAAADGAASRPRWLSLAPVYGAAAALVLGVAIWMHHSPSDKLNAMADGRSSIEDLEMVASNDQLEFLQDDPEFYEWADKSDAAGAASASGTTG
jgi:hypothetical protein